MNEVAIQQITVVYSEYVSVLSLSVQDTGMLSKSLKK